MIFINPNSVDVWFCFRFDTKGIVTAIIILLEPHVEESNLIVHDIYTHVYIFTHTLYVYHLYEMIYIHTCICLYMSFTDLKSVVGIKKKRFAICYINPIPHIFIWSAS